MKRKPIKSPAAAIRAYYEKEAISNKDILEIFGQMSSSTVAEMKKAVRVVERERNIPIFQDRYVHTDTAFEVWGVNIKTVESKFKMISRLKEVTNELTED